MSWLISLLMGVIGGNLGGAILKKFSLGLLGNSLAGIVGGVGGMLLLNQLGVGAGNPLINQIAGGGIGGMVVMVVVGLIKSLLAKK